jgi:anti-sigma B factor antagonist
MNGHVSECTAQGLTMVRLAGDQDVATVARLRGRLSPSPGATRPDIVIDLREVGFIDCAVVGAMIGARNAAAGAGGRVHLAGLQRLPERVLRLCGLIDSFCVHDGLNAGTAVFDGQASSTSAVSP